MATYKLVYFDGMGRAEMARLIFAQAGQDYEDKRIQGAEWAEEKKNTPFGQVPVLFVDDKPLSQSGAIVRFLAREFGLCGESSLQAAYIDMVAETLGDVAGKLPFMEKDPALKKEKAEKAKNDNITPVLCKMEKKLAEKKGDYMIGTKLSYADIALMQISFALEGFFPGIMDQYPTLKGIRNRVAALENIKKWLDSRPKTAF